MILIAKYNEDVSWLNDLKFPYIIYDKSKDIPNVGRESETYLRYIIENYNNLPDIVVFLQGNPFDHLKIRSTNYINDEIQTHINSDCVIPLNNFYHECHNVFTRTRESYNALFNTEIPHNFGFSPGAQYIVPKECILYRPLEYYTTIVNVMRNINNTKISNNNCLVCPWTIERMWPYIFNKNIPHKNIIYNDLL